MLQSAMGPTSPVTTPDAASPAHLRLACWPAGALGGNLFLPVLLDALRRRGVRTISLDLPYDADPEAIDVLLLNWAEAVFWGARSRWDLMRRVGRLLWWLARRPRRVKVIWIVHNLAPHETSLLTRLIWRPYLAALTRLIDGALTLSPGTVAPVLAAFPGLSRHSVGHVWHPAYPETPVTESERSDARAAIGVDEDARVIAYVGQIRPYKGLDELLARFAETSAPNLRLLVAGRYLDVALARRLEALAASDGRILLRWGALDAAQYRAMHAAADIIAAPLRRYLHSGSLIHALSLGRPVLTPATAFSYSLAAALGESWVKLYEGAMSAEALETAQGASGAIDLSPLAPDRVAADLERFCLELRQGR